MTLLIKAPPDRNKVRQAWDTLVDERSGANKAHFLELAKEFTEQYPDDPRGWYLLAEAFSELYSHDEARAALLNGGVRRHWLFSLTCGRVCDAKGEWLRASRWYKRAVKAGGDTKCIIFLGGNLARQGLLRDAERWHRKAIEREDDLLDEACLNLGFVLRAMGRYTEALEAFDRALAVTPEYPEAAEAREDVILARRITDSGLDQP